jgi:Amt family ammonium transporter
MFDRLKIDDPVGALSVHLLNGVWGTLAVGLFADSSVAPVTGPPDGLFAGGGLTPFLTQLVGVLAAGGYTFVVALAAWAILKAVMGIRVSPEEEFEGLDVGEHGMTAYPDFVIHGPTVGEPGFPTGGGVRQQASYATKPVHA